MTKTTRILTAGATLGALILLLIIASLSSAVPVDFSFTENFDSYTAGQDPPAPWSVIEGLDDNSVRVFADPFLAISDPNIAVLYGNVDILLGSVIYHPVTLESHTEVTFWVLNGGGPLGDGDGDCPTLYDDCHEKYGGVELSMHPHWRNLDTGDNTANHRGLIQFTHDGRIRVGEFELDEITAGQGQDAGAYTFGQWYEVKLIYDRINASQVRVSAYLYPNSSNDFLGSLVLPVKSYENDLAYIGFWAGAGSAWYDDIAVVSNSTLPTPTPSPSPTPTPEPADCNDDVCLYLPSVMGK